MMKKQYIIPTLDVIELHATMNIMAGSAVGTGVYEEEVSDKSGFGREDDFWDE